MFIRVFFFFLLSFSFSKAIEVCYKGYYLFFPLVVNCVNYEDNKVKAVAYSTKLGSLFKPVRYEGFSTYTTKPNLTSKEFFFIQIEGKHKFIHRYIFKKNQIIYLKKHFKKSGDKFTFKEEKKKVFKLKEKFFDPFTVSIYFYKVVFKKKEGFLPIFYDGRTYKVPFKVLRKEKVKINGKTYKTLKVFVNPNFKTKGLLRPTGNWYVWIDKKLKIPVKMKINFTVGSFKLEVEKIN